MKPVRFLTIDTSQAAFVGRLQYEVKKPLFAAFLVFEYVADEGRQSMGVASAKCEIGVQLPMRPRMVFEAEAQSLISEQTFFRSFCETDRRQQTIQKWIVTESELQYFAGLVNQRPDERPVRKWDLSLLNEGPRLFAAPQLIAALRSSILDSQDEYSGRLVGGGSAYQVAIRRLVSKNKMSFEILALKLDEPVHHSAAANLDWQKARRVEFDWDPEDRVPSCIRFSLPVIGVIEMYRV